MSLRKTILVLCLLVLSVHAGAQVYIVKEPTTCLYGLKDSSAKWILKPTYTLIEKSHGRENRFKVLLNNKNGIINERGQVIVQVIYDDIDELNIGYANDPDSILRKQYEEENKKLRGAYEVKANGLWGIIDSAGKKILPIAFFSIERFKNAVAVVKSADGKTGFVNYKGIVTYLPEKYSLQPIYYNQWEFAPRRYKIFCNKNGKIFYGICNEKAELVLPCEFESITEDGFRIQSFCAWKNGLAGFYSMNGKQLTEHIYAIPTENRKDDHMYGFRLMQNGKRGVLGQNAIVEIPFIYDSLKFCYSENSQYYFLGYKDKKWGLYNNKNELIIPEYFERIYQPAYRREQFYCIRSNGKWGAIDQFGNELMEIKFDTIFLVYRDLLFWSPEDAAVLSHNNKYGFLYLPGYKPDSLHYYEQAFTCDGKFELQSYSEYDSLHICKLTEKSDWDYSWMEPDKEGRKADEFMYANYFGPEPCFTVYHISQKSSPDSTWFLPAYRPEYDHWTTDPFFEGFDIPYPRLQPLIHKLPNGDFRIIPNLDYSHSFVGKSDYLIYRNYYDDPDRKPILVKNDLSFVNDTFTCEYLSFCAEGRGNPVFNSIRTSGYTNISQLVNRNGVNQLPAGYEFAGMLNADTAWVFVHNQIYPPCINAYNLYRLSTHQLLLPENQMLMIRPNMKSKNSIAARTSGYDFYDNRKMRFKTNAHYRMIMPLPVGKMDHYFAVLTSSGKTMITNANGKLLTDSLHLKIVSPYFFDWDENGFEAENIPLVFVNGNNFYRFEKNKLIPIDAAFQKQIIDSTIFDSNKESSYEYKSRIHKFYKMEFRPWQYALLMDSIFRSPLFADYRMEFNEDNFDEDYYEPQRYQHCSHWDSLPPELFRAGNRYVIETTVAGEGAFSYQRSEYSIESFPKLRSRKYYNVLLYQDSAVYIPLDSLFNGYAWKDFISQLLADSLDANPNYESPCMNANAYPYLLRYRFLMTNDKLLLYPEWRDKRYYYDEYRYYEFEIEIPWEKLKPYLKPEIAGKIGL